MKGVLGGAEEIEFLNAVARGLEKLSLESRTYCAEAEEAGGRQKVQEASVSLWTGGGLPSGSWEHSVKLPCLTARTMVFTSSTHSASEAGSSHWQTGIGNHAGKRVLGNVVQALDVHGDDFELDKGRDKPGCGIVEPWKGLWVSLLRMWT